MFVSCDSDISSDDDVRAHEEAETSELDVDEFAKHYQVKTFPPRNVKLLSDNLSYSSNEFQEKRNNYISSLSMSTFEAKMTEISSTRGQSDNPKWWQARKGRITASNFGRICRMRPTKAPENAVKEIMGYRKEPHGNEPYPLKAAPLQWGSQHESLAKERFVKYMKKGDTRDLRSWKGAL